MALWYHAGATSSSDCFPCRLPVLRSRVDERYHDTRTKSSVSFCRRLPHKHTLYAVTFRASCKSSLRSEDGGEDASATTYTHYHIKTSKKETTYLRTASPSPCSPGWLPVPPSCPPRWANVGTEERSPLASCATLGGRTPSR